MMCTFCENKTNYKELSWLMRNTGADDNICEFVKEMNCDICDGCSDEASFQLITINIDKDFYIGTSFYQKIKSSNGEYVVINPFSEKIHINFCPFCGKNISEKLIEFDNLEYIVS